MTIIYRVRRVQPGAPPVVDNTMIISAFLASIAMLSTPVIDFGAEVRGVNPKEALAKSGVEVAGLLILSVKPNGLADDLGLRVDDVIQKINDFHLIRPADIERAGIADDKQIEVIYARGGVVRTTTRPAKLKSQVKVAYVGADSDETIDILRKAGYTVAVSSGLPEQLTDHHVLVLVNPNACTPAIGPRLASYLAKDGNVVLIGDAPHLIAGKTTNFSSISEWFGASAGYGSDYADPNAAVASRFLEGNQRNGDVIWTFTGDTTIAIIPPDRIGGKGIGRLYVDGKTWDYKGHAALTNEYGTGRMFWLSFSPYHVQHPKLAEFFIAGLKWTIERR